MKKIPGILGNTLGIVLLIGIVVFMIFSLNGIRQGKNSGTLDSPDSTPILETEPTPVPQQSEEPAETVFESPLLPTATPTSGAVEPEPTATPVPVTEHPPLCKFEGKAQEAIADSSTLDAFEFSEPKVIFSRETPIEIVEWLPDNQRLLIQTENEAKQSVEVLDTTTGKTEVYADNLQNAGFIHWIAGENSVVYTDDKTDQFSGIDQYSLWLSRGAGKQQELLLKDATLLQTGATEKELPSEIAKVLNVHDFPFNPEQWRYNKSPEDSYFMESWAGVKLAASVSPDDSRAVFYNAPWLYLVDLKTNQPCEVELGQYYRAYNVEWSPNSRFVAMFTTTGYREELIKFTELQVLDTKTGIIYKPVLQDVKHLWALEWVSDNNFVVMGATNNHDNPYQNQQIMLIDVIAQTSRLVLPDYVFGGGQPDYQLKVSPDKGVLAIKCPDWSKEEPLILEDHLCYITITR